MRLWLAVLACVTLVVTLVAMQPPTTARAVTDETPAFVLNQNDLEFILRQIQISESHAAGNPLRCGSDTDLSGKCVNGDARTLGVRTVDGSENNLLVGQAQYGSADQAFPRLLAPEWRQADPNPPFPGTTPPTGPPGNPAEVVAMCEPGLTCYEQTDGIVYDSDPRTISNLIVDQTTNNPAIVNQLDAGTAFQDETTAGTDRVIIPNTAPDEGLSAPFNTFMGFFGQFFDHGLDLVAKGGNGTLIVPLQPDDPLYVEGSRTNFLTLTRATRIDDAQGNPTTEHVNLTTPFIDQNQTYSSHPSHQVFLREYDADGNSTGRLLEGSAHESGMATWNDVKAQAREVLGIDLTDADVLDVPLLLTDQYGHFIPGSERGLPQLVVSTGPNVDDVEFVEGDTSNPVSTADALGTGHAFLDDIAHGATPVVDEATGELLPRYDENGEPILDEAGQPVLAGYDNVTLGAHFIAGDGRVNENIGLTAVHHVFHAEHNRMVGQIEDLLNGERPELESGNLEEFANAFRGEAHSFPSAKAGEALPQPEDDDWTYEQRLFQAAKFATEMQYQHLVFEEFGRKVAPTIDEVVFNENSYNPGVDPAIFAEFAHVVYRFGHSMMTDTIGREAVEGGTQEFEAVPLFDGFLNPAAYDLDGTLTPEEAAGSIINGTTAQVGSQIDEHIVDTLRNQLLGLPLDLATINLLRARDVGIPPLQDARRTFFAATNEPSLRPYTSWTDFGLNIKNGDNFGRGGSNASLVNFVAAYGQHQSILDATTLEEKREAAALLVNGAPQGEEFVVRHGGNDRYHTAQLIAERHFTGPVPVVFVAAGANFPDALAGGPLAAALGGPILLAAPDAIPAPTAQAIGNLRPERIVILGGPGTVGPNAETTLNALLQSVTPGAPAAERIAGVNRFETAALIADEFPNPGGRVFITNGFNFPDALGGGAVAARDESPVLLVNPTALPAETAAALEALEPSEIVILGSEAAVSAGVASQLAGYTAGSVTRLGGADRYLTAIAISQEFFEPGGDSVYLATGANFPDALAASPAAGLNGAPLLLVPPTGLTPELTAELTRLAPQQVHILGSASAVSLDTEVALAALAPAPVEAPGDRLDFMNSTGDYANVNGETVTGLEDVDFWVGGLAERLNPFGGMLGSTFNFVFEMQMEALQFGDRFYYLFRNQGQQLFAALEGNTFSDLIQRNTDASNLPADIFALHDPILDLENLPDPLPEGLLQMPDGTWRWDGDEHIELHGTPDADRIRGDEGDDALWGYGGDDVIEGGAGNDALVGGPGDDIITDSFGDDNIKGMQGNDAINAGPGIDLTIGGIGDDFIMGGGDPKTTFAGMGDDVVLGTSGRMTVFGGEHDDWVEGSSHADLLQGDNADQFQTDVLGGNDVVIGGLGNDDIEGEGGDDILIGRAVGTDRHLGNLGFDWLTYYGETLNVTADFAFSRVFQQQNPLPSRFDHLEALSGGQGNDTLRGAMVSPDDLLENEIPLTKATEESLTLVDGLTELLRPAGAPFDYAAPFLRGTPESDTDGVHEIVIGGVGSDVVEGRGGNDFLDGDAMLRVQLVHTPTGERFDSAAQVQARVFSGEINPGDLDIVREIVIDDEDAAASLDTAFYNNPIGSYQITQLPNGYWQVDHVVVQEVEESDGVDVIHGFEVLQFADGCATLNAAGDAWEACEATAELALSTDSPVEDQPITATLQAVGGGAIDATGFTNVQYTWWAGEGEDAGNVTEWEPLVVVNVNAGQDPTTNTYIPDDLAVGSFLRVTVAYRDADGFFRTATSPVTANVVENQNDVPTLPTIVASPSGLLTVTPPTDGDGFNEDDPGFTYQWFRDGVAIEGATASTYTQVAEDVGLTITVQVFYTDLHGTAESPTSAGYVVLVAG
ncbi:peroxidase family protein [Agromyces sp. Marseille-P2726]|uniref:peroxidase family protein n=1 Tax=Agromyces sp. Marseille-P2726 TaxID=2709132 RepID=UPI00156FBC48|nr:peroxidase family protein [Agromyces sp. Marseille-P2726]